MLDFEKCPNCEAKMVLIRRFKVLYKTMCINCEYLGPPGKTVEEAKDKWNQTGK